MVYGPLASEGNQPSEVIVIKLHLSSYGVMIRP